jgi:1-acyl-sn-glycerol-3-phosphate acyltransferase
MSNENDNYVTPTTKKRLLRDKIFRLFNLYFYYRCFKVVYRCAWHGKRRLLNHPNLIREAQGMLDTVEDCGGKVIITGTENIPPTDTPVVFVANHMSTLETMSLPSVLRRHKVTYVVKESLLTYPIFGHIMSGLDCIPMTRTNPAADLKRLFKEGSAHLKNGTSVIIFPQRTRGLHFSADDFNSIGCKLARRCKVPVIPVALKTDFWTLGKLVSEIGPVCRDKDVRFSVGPLFEICKENEKEVHNKCAEFISSQLAEWQTED